MRYSEEDILSIIEFTKENIDIEPQNILHMWRFNESNKLSEDDIKDLNRLLCYDSPFCVDGEKAGEVIIISMHSEGSDKKSKIENLYFPNKYAYSGFSLKWDI